LEEDASQERQLTRDTVPDMAHQSSPREVFMLALLGLEELDQTLNTSSSDMLVTITALLAQQATRVEMLELDTRTHQSTPIDSHVLEEEDQEEKDHAQDHQDQDQDHQDHQSDHQVEDTGSSN
jgi:ABC-type Zn2+ transport system substrate-binding protein/surface adhesin